MSNAIVLCSGGLDSVILAHYLKKTENFENLKLVFLDYEQKSLNEELFCVKKAAEELNADLNIIDVKWLGKISTSLINKEANENEIDSEELISWYVPCRNTIFVSSALAHAESDFLSKKITFALTPGL